MVAARGAARPLASTIRQASTSAGPSTSSSSLVPRLIAAAQPQIPAYGFNRRALEAGLREDPELQSEVSSINSWTLDKLFPGSDADSTSIPMRLFSRWEQDQMASLKGKGKQQESETMAYEEAVGLLENRLRGSSEVRQHLLQVSCGRKGWSSWQTID